MVFRFGKNKNGGMIMILGEVENLGEERRITPQRSASASFDEDGFIFQFAAIIFLPIPSIIPHEHRN